MLWKTEERVCAQCMQLRGSGPACCVFERCGINVWDVGKMFMVLFAIAALLFTAYVTMHLLHRCSQKAFFQKPPLHFAFTPQVKFAYHQCGRPSDPLVLVVHGFPDTAASFCPILASLSSQGKPLSALMFKSYTLIPSDNETHLILTLVRRFPCCGSLSPGLLSLVSGSR